MSAVDYSYIVPSPADLSSLLYSSVLCYDPLPRPRSVSFDPEADLYDSKGRRKPGRSSNPDPSASGSASASALFPSDADDSSLPPLTDEEIAGDSSLNTPNLAHNTRKNTHSSRLHPMSTCSICSSEFYSDKELQCHNAEAHQKYQCFACSHLVLLTSQRAVRMHIKRFHSNPKEKYSRCGFQCSEFCGRFFEDIHDLKNHIGTHEYAFRCEKCPKAFSTMTRLQNHVAGQHFLEDRIIVDTQARRERKAPTRLVELVDPDVVMYDPNNNNGGRVNGAMRPSLRMMDSDGSESEGDKSDPAFKAPRGSRRLRSAYQQRKPRDERALKAIVTPLRAHLLFNSEDKLRLKCLPPEPVEKYVRFLLGGIAPPTEEIMQPEMEQPEEAEEGETENIEAAEQEAVADSQPTADAAAGEDLPDADGEVEPQRSYVKRTKKSAFKSTIMEVRTFQIEDTDSEAEAAQPAAENTGEAEQSKSEDAIAAVSSSPVVHHREFTSADWHVDSDEEKPNAEKKRVTNESANAANETGAAPKQEANSGTDESAVQLPASEPIAVDPAQSSPAPISSVEGEPPNDTASPASAAAVEDVHSESESDYHSDSESKSLDHLQPAAASDRRVSALHVCRCPLLNCSKLFACDVDLFAHMRESHRKYICVARTCLRVFDSSVDYEHHIEAADDDNTAGCSLCCARFATAAIAKVHSRVHQLISVCPIAGCGGRFRSPAQLALHAMQIHGIDLRDSLRSKNKPAELSHLSSLAAPVARSFAAFSVPLDPEKEREREKRKRARERTRSPNMETSCSISSCPQSAPASFGCDAELNDHFIAAHSLYRCFWGDCPSVFPSAAERSNHFAVHNIDSEDGEVLPHGCELCGQRVKLAANLSRHMCIHYRMISCHCGRSYILNAPNAMEKHAAKYHKAKGADGAEEDEDDDSDEQNNKKIKREMPLPPPPPPVENQPQATQGELPPSPQSADPAPPVPMEQ